MNVKERTGLIMGSIPFYPQEVTVMQLAKKLKLPATTVRTTIKRNGDGWLVCESDGEPVCYSRLRGGSHVD